MPLETFLEQVDALARECDRVLVLGTSFGAEAALLTALLTISTTAETRVLEQLSSGGPLAGIKVAAAEPDPDRYEASFLHCDVLVVSFHGGTELAEEPNQIQKAFGRAAVDAIFFRDYPVLQGAILMFTLAVLIANLATDVVYAYLDPRIRYR